MKFTQIPVADKKYLNYIFIEVKVAGKPLIAMFDTRGNSLIKKSVADTIDITYLDKDPIDERRGWKRARANLNLGGLEIGSAPIVVANDDSFYLPKDPTGNDFPADMILGWNIISQLSFRADLRKNIFEVQIDDFKEPSSKEKGNSPVLYVEFEGERILAAINSSLPITTVSQKVFDKIIGKTGARANELEILGLADENLSYETKLRFKIDEDTIILPQAQLNPHLNDEKVDIVFGADLLQSTTWAMYSPQRYFRARQ